MTKQLRVAMIPDNTTIVLNSGSNDNDEIYVGRKIEIYIPGKEIIDPESEEIIGVYDLVKEKLEITALYESYSVARKVKEIKKSPLLAIASPMLNEKTYTTFATIEVDGEQNLELQLENKQIQIGDHVKLV